MRLRKSWEFLSVKKNGSGYKNRLFWFKITLSKDSEEYPKLGIIASRRFGCAVKRNKAKRIIREIFRSNLNHFPRGSRIVIIPRIDLLSSTYKEIESKIIQTISKTIIN